MIRYQLFVVCAIGLAVSVCAGPASAGDTGAAAPEGPTGTATGTTNNISSARQPEPMATKTVYDSKAHYQALYDTVPRRFAFTAKTRTEFAAWQKAFRRELRGALGLANMERDLRGYKPRAEKADETDMGDYVREKWYLWTEPDVPLPFWLLRPKGASGKLPLVLTPHGHNHPDLYVGIARDEAEQESIAAGQRDIAVQAVRQGYIAIAPTARGFGETRTNEDRKADKGTSCRTELLHGLLVGRTAIGERVWDISRLIDWALKRGDVDGTRIAITGNSGGGTTSLFAAACEERITVAVPSCYFCTFAGSIGTIFHCDCNYVPGVMRLGEMYDVAGLIAPRPFRAIAGKDDGIFPIKYVRESYARLKEIYTVAGVPDRCTLYVGAGGHRYYSAGAWPFVKKWFSEAGASR
jgi:hypothetical protein